jgi:hypothetical protein
LGQFNLPVTITPLSNTNFFIDPVNGNDAFPGTAAQPWQFVEKALDLGKPTGSTVAAAANAGNNVVVTILSGGTENVVAPINTPILSAGSVTVLQAPFKKTFTLNMAANTLTLNKGYKLKDIIITPSLGAAGTAVTINHPTAGLASVDVKCGGAVATNCVEVKGAGSHILKDVRVDVTNAGGSVGILNNDTNINLTIVGGRVRTTGNAGPVTLIDSKGVLTATSLEVDMTNAGHQQNSTGIVIRAAGSSVTNSTIKVNNDASAGGTGAIGIDVQAGPSTVANNNFVGFGLNTIGINGATNLSPASVGNDFSGPFGTTIQ